ncbi:immunity 42 family protein [Pseudomonas sp. D2-3]
MIFGDPSKFAILIDRVGAWTAEGNYENGIFHYVIDGAVMPDLMSVATLGGDISCLSDSNSLVLFPENESFFKGPKQDVFVSALQEIFPTALDPSADVPDDFVEDYTYQASTYNLESNGFYVFAAASGDVVRILGAKVSSLSPGCVGNLEEEAVVDLNVFETFVVKHEVDNILAEVRAFFGKQ